MNQLKDLISRIVNAVAEADGVDSITLEPPLAEVVDLDALQTLIENTTASDLEVHFAYRGHDVAVNESGRVQVE